MALIGSGALVASMQFASAATAAPEPRLACEYVEAGVVGPMDNVLIVKSRGGIQTVSVDQGPSGEIAVSGKRTGEADCSGPATPTTTNLDRVEFAGGRRSSLELEVSVLGPGASSEVDGTPEIEISLVQDPITFFTLRGSGQDETFALQSTRGRTEIDLSPSPAVGFERDIDLGSGSFVQLNGGGGADMIDAAESRGASVLFGARGDDTILGGAGPDFAVGGGGDDEIRTGRGDDLLDGTPGQDLMRAGSGDDFVFAVDDSGDDVLECGSGRDEYAADRDDSVRSCEREFEFP